MFTGEYNCVIDNKNRMAIPSAIRKRIKDDDIPLYLTIGIGQYLSIYTNRVFEKLRNKIEDISFTDESSQDFQRYIASQANELESWDKQGRIVIPQNHKEHANLDKEVVVIGSMNMLEIWDANVWEDHKKDIAPKFKEIARKIRV